MEENKNKVNNAESYDFMADANATFKGLIDRTKEHGLFEQDEEKRVLVCMALDFETGKSLITAHGRPSYAAVAIAANIIHNDLKERVNTFIDMYERGELKIHEEGTEYENAEEVQDAEPAAEPGGDE